MWSSGAFDVANRATDRDRPAALTTFSGHSLIARNFLGSDYGRAQQSRQHPHWLPLVCVVREEALL